MARVPRISGKRSFGSTGRQRSNPWATLVGGEEFNPFSGEFQRNKGEGLIDFRERLAQQVGQLEQETGAEASAQRISDIASGLTEKVSGDQLAGEAAEDVDQQFAQQSKALQLRQSRMGLDPSQNASVTGQRQAGLAQAAARAGAIQGARRSAEDQNRRGRQSNLSLASSIVGRDVSQQQDRLSTLQRQGMGAETDIARNRTSFKRDRQMGGGMNPNTMNAAQIKRNQNQFGMGFQNQQRFQ